MHSTILIFIALCLYFLPTIFAVYLEHKDHRAICVLNLFLGWTFIGGVS